MKIVLKPDKGPVHFQVATGIRKMIVKDYQLGALLPSHRELSAIFGVGLRSVTNAMKLLTQQGIVTPIRKKGTVVSRLPSSVEERLSRIALVSRADSTRLFTGFNSQIMSGISSNLDQLEVGLLLFPRKNNSYTPAEEVLAAGADGIVILGSVDDEYLNIYSKTDIPLVLVNNHPANISVDAVVCDNFGAVATLINHLFDKGHKNISYATFSSTNNLDSDNIERREAFLLEMKCHTTEPCRTICEMWLPVSDTSDSSPRALVHAIKSGKDAPTVIVTDSEGTASVLIEMLEKENILVPRDISVAAIAQTPDVIRNSPSAITGCCMNFEEMGTRAIDLIVEQCQDNRYAPRTIRVGYKLVEGCSVKTLNG